MAIVCYLIHSLWKIEFQDVYIRLPALVCSILNVVNTVRTVKVLYSTSASVCWMCLSVYWRISRYIYCIGGWFKSAGRLFVCVRVCSELVTLTDVWGQPIGSIFKGPLKTWPIICPETLVRYYHYSPRNNPEQRISQLLRSGSQKLSVFAVLLYFHYTTFKTLISASVSTRNLC
jgi:hypothetical protein